MEDGEGGTEAEVMVEQGDTRRKVLASGWVTGLGDRGKESGGVEIQYEAASAAPPSHTTNQSSPLRSIRIMRDTTSSMLVL